VRAVIPREYRDRGGQITEKFKSLTDLTDLTDSWGPREDPSPKKSPQEGSERRISEGHLPLSAPGISKIGKISKV